MLTSAQIGNIHGTSCDEYVWNDTFFGGQRGATGGGISDFFRTLPSYQNGAGVPKSLNDEHVGRGLPDVAANASPNSGFFVTVGGQPGDGNGTSASAPLWAGLVAVLNAALGGPVGFINPALYAVGSAGFRDIFGPPGPKDNGINGVAGYPCQQGWDACTGWGSPNGKALLAGLQDVYTQA
jgi:kumamolisin